MFKRMLPYMALFGMLLIGVIVGWSGSRWARYCRPEPHPFFSGRMDSQNFEKKIEGKLMRVIDPSKEQESKLQPILHKYSTRMKDHMEGHRREFVVMMDAMKSELDSVLDSAQMVRFLDHKNRFGRVPSHMRLVGDRQ